jgi:hypothetical protein
MRAAHPLAYFLTKLIWQDELVVATLQELHPFEASFGSAGTHVPVKL